jgi:membrane protein DedA with SNARE-associated domain
MITLTTHPTFLSTLQWLLQNSYPVMFLGMIIEGPTIIAAASFAVTMGYFNLVTIFILAVLGDVIGDFIFYSLGYFGKTALFKKYDRKHKVSETRLDKLKSLVHKHPGKIVAIVKLAPLLPMPGLVAIGSTHLPPKKFAKIILAIIIPKTILFMAIGYFFGHAYTQIYKIINDGVLGIIIVVVFLFLMQYGYKKISDRISQRLERD